MLLRSKYYSVTLLCCAYFAFSMPPPPNSCPPSLYLYRISAIIVVWIILNFGISEGREEHSQNFIVNLSRPATGTEERFDIS
jgi:hypothetical protein